MDVSNATFATPRSATETDTGVRAPPLDRTERMFDTGWVEYVRPPPPWEAGRQSILNSTGALCLPQRRLFGGNAGVEADRDPARIGELAVPTHLRADRGPFGLDNAVSACGLREDAV